MNTEKIEVSELQGRALDWAVGLAHGYGMRLFGYLSVRAITETGGNIAPFHPTFDWRIAGPIIDREGIALRRTSNGMWHAMLSADLGNGTRTQWGLVSYIGVPAGERPRLVRFGDLDSLTAAMRCYVASKLGPVVEVPAGLQGVCA